MNYASFASKIPYSMHAKSKSIFIKSPYMKQKTVYIIIICAKD
jgi:hypothetical protein